jgi:hypothetical protein
MRSDKYELLKAVSHPDIFFEMTTGFKPEPFQSQVLAAITGRHQNKQFITIALAARGSGKTMALAVGAAYMAITDPGKVVPLICPSMRQSQMLLRMTSDILGNLPVRPGRITNAKQTLELSNRSQIICLPLGTESDELERQSSVRGVHSTVALCDEICGFPSEIIRSGVLPIVLPSGGRVVCAGSPAGQTGWVYTVWMSGECLRIHAPADTIGHLPMETLESLKKSMTESEISREINAVFSADEEQAFHLSGFDIFIDECVAL